MSQFTIETVDRTDTTRLALAGHLDAHTAPNLEEAIRGLVDDGSVRMVVDFSGLDYISSAGLGVFMSFIEEVRAAGGDIKLAAMRPNVFEVFELLGFPLFYDIVDTCEEAENKFAAG